MNRKKAVKANVGTVAALTVDLIKRGVSVHNLADTYPTDVLPRGRESLWFVSAPKGSRLKYEVLTIPLAYTQYEAWELAIQYLAANHEISEDLKAGVVTHRRTLRKVWQDMRAHGDYAVECDAYASEHYGSPFRAWDRVVCWLGGAATGFFQDECGMPFKWRLMGKSAADWNAFVSGKPGQNLPAIGYAEMAAER
ncbi:hypothetical protein [Cupriavidus sp. UYPR2.512]|uniref:hypothetical protein n=1 Tax=Cupriavidus sp. UYPR2.512 TaxID=1080187 RepID=UPI00037688F1|nr:hypothetical protein [Cupriavidus sp. UYPR2.512]UIF89429.1 hypothetical protein KAF44_29610 [Cupriavidus necator]